MHRNGARVVAVVLSCLASACASGPPGPPGGGPPGGPGGGPGAQLQESKITRPVALLFTGMDTNRDLVVSTDELNHGIDQEFARADVDKSGVITGFEMADWCKAVMGDAAAMPVAMHVALFNLVAVDLSRHQLMILVESGFTIIRMGDLAQGRAGHGVGRVAQHALEGLVGMLNLARFVDDDHADGGRKPTDKDKDRQHRVSTQHGER